MFLTRNSEQSEARRIAKAMAFALQPSGSSAALDEVRARTSGGFREGRASDQYTRPGRVNVRVVGETRRSVDAPTGRPSLSGFGGSSQATGPVRLRPVSSGASRGADPAVAAASFATSLSAALPETRMSRAVATSEPTMKPTSKPGSKPSRTFGVATVAGTTGYSTKSRSSRQQSFATGLTTMATSGASASSAVALALDIDYSETVRRPQRSASTTPRFHVVAKNKPRRSRAVPYTMLVVGVLLAIGSGAVTMHVALAQTQLNVDRLNIEIEQHQRMNQRLRVEVASLEAPDRVVTVAESLGLQAPQSVRYLAASTAEEPLPIAATTIAR